MALQTSGPISLNQIHIEGGGTTGTSVNVNKEQVRNLIFKGSSTPMSFSEWYGSGRINNQFQLKRINVSDYISSGETFTIPTSAWIWSDSTSHAALVIDIPCTVVNKGKIIGMGGDGGRRGSLNGKNGGPAIQVTSTGVTINNNSIGYICGGGGGGSAAELTSDTNFCAGGGGGAGGGTAASFNTSSSTPTYTGTGGSLNQEGTSSLSNSSDRNEAGGQGGSSGGGRIVPGRQSILLGDFDSVVFPSATVAAGGAGGQDGNDGGIAINDVYPGGYSTGGGGGGWGSAGGDTVVNFTYQGTTYTNFYTAAFGGSGGPAITGTARTLNNSGTIYGTT